MRYGATISCPAFYVWKIGSLITRSRLCTAVGSVLRINVGLLEISKLILEYPYGKLMHHNVW